MTKTIQNQTATNNNGANSNKRIAKNTIFLYLRMLLVMFVSLYTSRIVLDLLGIVDYGIYNVVGGIVAMLGFLSSTMSNVVQRFLSFEMGKGNVSNVNTIFNIAIQAHLVIAIIVVVVMEFVGIWYLDNYINLPGNRLEAAHWVLQSAIISTFFTILQIPYNGMIIAKEDMSVYAYISIIEVLLKLCVCFLLFYSIGDKLKLYSIVMAIVTILIVLSYCLYCIRFYQECKLKRCKNSLLLRQMGSFACWNLIGEISWCFKGQGVNIVLNFFFGPIVNAAGAISEQVNAAVSKFVTNFQMAVNPQLIKTYASNDKERTKSLLYHTIRLSYFLLLAISLPIIGEMAFILNLWLTEVPEYTVGFCQLTLICSLVNTISNPLAQVVRANGNIKNYQLVISIAAFVCFPLSALSLYLGASPYATIWISLVISFALIIIRVHFAKKYIILEWSNFFIKVIWPIIKVTIICIIIIFPIYFMIENKIWNFLATTFISFILVCIVSFNVGMEKGEKQFIVVTLKKVITKIK